MKPTVCTKLTVCACVAINSMHSYNFLSYIVRLEPIMIVDIPPKVKKHQRSNTSYLHFTIVLLIYLLCFFLPSRRYNEDKLEALYEVALGLNTLTLMKTL